MMSPVLSHNDINAKLFISANARDGALLVNTIERAPHEVLTSTLTLEQVFAHMHPRMLCRAARVSRRWHAVAYGQPALWCDIDSAECMRSDQSCVLSQARFGRLRGLVVPASFVKSHGIPTHCAQCAQPLPEHSLLGFTCICEFPLRDNTRGDIGDVLQGNFCELRTLNLCIPPLHLIDPSSLSQFKSLTSLCLENLNPLSATAYGSLISQNEQLRGLTYLTRPWLKDNGSPFSYAGLQLESLEVNQLDFADILHMTSCLKSLKINGYDPIDKYLEEKCITNVESIVCFTRLEVLDISGVHPSEVANAPWTALHICMLTNLQRLEVGPVFSTEDFSYMSRDLSSLRGVGIHDNFHFSNTILQDFVMMDIASSLTTLHIRNCMVALAEPSCLASLPQLRSLRIEQDIQQVGTLRKLAPTLVQMTQLVDLALVGLSINPVQIYPKLTSLQRLVLNRTPVSDEDLFIMGKKLPNLRHLGVVGCIYLTLKSLNTLISTVGLEVLEWDDPSHVKPLISSFPHLSILMPLPIEPLQPLIGMGQLNPKF